MFLGVAPVIPVVGKKSSACDISLASLSRRIGLANSCPSPWAVILRTSSVDTLTTIPLNIIGSLDASLPYPILICILAPGVILNLSGGSAFLRLSSNFSEYS